MKTLVTKINIYPEGSNPILGLENTEIELTSDGGVPFIAVRQFYSGKGEEIRLEVNEIDDIIAQLRYFKSLLNEVISNEG